jgi:hypothetical protein
MHNALRASKPHIPAVPTVAAPLASKLLGDCCTHLQLPELLLLLLSAIIARHLLDTLAAAAAP